MNLPKMLELKFPSEWKNGLIRCNSYDGLEWEIGTWDVEMPFPTEDDLTAWMSEMDLPYRQQLAVSKRNYPSIGEQLDMMYKDIKNGTSNWVDLIEQIKTTNPKPVE